MRIEEYKKNAELIDLHTHTCYSDGELNPNQLLKMAISRGVKTISITDHDTLLGIKNILQDEGHNETEYIDVIPGIELTAKTDIGRMHILGYGFDLDDKKLNSRMKELQQNSINSVLAMICQLDKNYGITINPKDIAKLITANRNIGRPDIARILVEYGIVSSVDEAFKKYLIAVYEKTRGKTNKLNPGECIELIKWAGGIPILAHPHTLKRDDKDLLILIKELVSMGLNGLEVYHSNNTKEQEQYYMQMVQDLNLLYSGGSDYHGINVKPDIEIGTGKGNLKIKEVSVVNYLRSRK
jgi:predicted metal-dependent phosphoesterase TrpH